MIILHEEYNGFESWADIDRDVEEALIDSKIPPEGRGTITVTIKYEPVAIRFKDEIREVLDIKPTSSYLLADGEDGVIYTRDDFYVDIGKHKGLINYYAEVYVQGRRETLYGDSIPSVQDIDPKLIELIKQNMEGV